MPATPETPDNIASVTKPLSAVVALRLVERGQLDLDGAEVERSPFVAAFLEAFPE